MFYCVLLYAHNGTFNYKSCISAVLYLRCITTVVSTNRIQHACMLRTFAKLKVVQSASLFSDRFDFWREKFKVEKLQRVRQPKILNPQFNTECVGITWVDGGRKLKKVQGGGWNKIFFNTHHKQARRYRA